MRVALPVSVAALLVAGVACTASSTTADGAPSPVATRTGGLPGAVTGKPPSTAQLVDRADLDPCPASGTAGGELPSLTLPCLGGGDEVALDRLTGTPTVVNLWASWCEPCQRETPFLQSLYADAGDRLRVIGVDTEDSPRSALDFAAHVGMRYPSVVDEDGQVLRHFRAVGPPLTVFLDAQGTVRHVKRGEYDSAAALRHDVATYLGVHL